MTEPNEAAQDEPSAEGARPESEWVPESLQSLPACWGPLVNESDRQQLGAFDRDLAKYTDELGPDADELIDLLASTSPRRRFLVFQKLSATRWAAVFRAIDCHADRLVVLKISCRTVDVEARMAVMASHPNVITVYDSIVCEGRPTMVVEWCSQGTLHTFAHWNEDWREVLARGLEAGRGLAHAHACGTIHGDVKPTNIFITDGMGKLADFGIAQAETLAGSTAGTPQYAPPERELGIWTPAGDVYSYAATIEAVLAKFPDVPKQILEVLTAAMVGDPNQRPTMNVLIEQLELARNEAECERADRERVREDAREDARETGRQRRWAFAQAVAVSAAAAMVGTVALATVCSVPSKVERREPSIERAIELADAGDAMGAWLEYHRLEEASEPVLAEDALQLAEILMRSTSLGPPEARTAAAVLAERVAMRGANAAKRAQKPELQIRLSNIASAAREFIRLRN